MMNIHKLALLSTLLFSSATFAATYELTPLVGYNFAEKNIKLKNYTVIGGELQYNGFNTAIKPEISFLYSIADYKKNLLSIVNSADVVDTNVMRFLFNGVYEFNNSSAITPLLKAGIGYETMDNAYGGNREGSPLADLGLAVKMSLGKSVALKLETLYMAKYNNRRYDHNLALFAGLTISFGGYDKEITHIIEQEVETETEVEPLIAPVIEPIVQPTEEESRELVAIPESYEGTIETDEYGAPKKINLGLEFKMNSTVLDDAYKSNIDRFVAYLNKYPQYSVKIAGFADSIGTYEYNQALSLKRAEVIKDMLIEKGIDAQRLTATGSGEYNPIATNMYKDGRAQNRRIEATLLK